MKSSNKMKILIILGYTLILLTSANNLFTRPSISFSKDDSNSNISFPSTNGYWNLTETPISIDDTIPNKNWSYTANIYDWCSGSGTWSDPYIIENVTINGQNNSTCIEIKNSNAYFIIRNSTLYNSSSDYQNAAIKLDHVINGKIINNTVFNNLFSGILLLYSDNNSIIENYAHNNEIGIYSFFSNNNTISGTIACYNEKAISVFFSDNLIIKENVVNNCLIGIYLHMADDNKLVNNTVDNAKSAVFFEKGNHNNIMSGNMMYNCGIQMLKDSIEILSTNIIDSSNLVNNKPVYNCKNKIGLVPSNFSNAGQIILINCSYSNISGVNVSSGTIGISMFSCDNNTVSDNLVSYNSICGIYIHSSNCNILSNNTANYNLERGMILANSNHTLITENIANSNGYIGISLSYSQNNIVSKNTACLNQDSGIEVYVCNNNTIADNVLNNNSIGIYMSGSFYNTVLENTANFNSGHGIGMFGSDFNSVSSNIANDNSYGIYLYNSNNNSITNNILYRNTIDCIRELICVGNIINNNKCEPEEPVEPIPSIFGYDCCILILAVISVISLLIVKTRNQKMS